MQLMVCWLVQFLLIASNNGCSYLKSLEQASLTYLLMYTVTHGHNATSEHSEQLVVKYGQ